MIIKKVALSLLAVTAGSIFIVHKLSIANQLKAHELHKTQSSLKSVTIKSDKKDVSTSDFHSSKPNTSSQEQAKNQVNEKDQIESSLPKTTIQSSEGLNFNGKHYDIRGFSGLGHVPADEYVYQWLDYTEHLHLLAERKGQIGIDVRELAVGSKIIVNNQTYTVYNVMSGVTNDGNAYNSLSIGEPVITIQSCDSEDDDATLTIWYAA